MKNAKKLLCLLLVFTMAFTLLVACKREPDTDDPAVDPNETKTTEINLSEYSLIRSAKSGSAVNAAVKSLVTVAKNVLDGTELVSERDNKVEANAATKEILVGLTNRTESTDAQTALGDEFAFVIRVVGNKIVVTGATNELIVKGLNYLSENYISKAENGVAKIPTDLTVKQEYHEIVTNGISNYVLMYSENVGGTENFDTVRYIWQEINRFTTEDLEFKDDHLREGDSYDLTKKAIVVGDTNYPHSKELSKNLDLFGWAMESKDDLIYLCAFEKNALADMSGEFTDRLDNAILLSTANAEAKTIRMCKIERMAAAGNKWKTAVPVFAGGEADTFQQIDRGFYRLRYADATKAEYDAYTATLASEGFIHYASNTLDNCVFNTYYKGDVMVHTYYMNKWNANNEKNATVSVVIAGATSAPLVPLEAYGDEAVTEANLKLMNMKYDQDDDGKLDHNNGMGFVFTMSDGSYVVVDGGYAEDAEPLYNFMRDNNKREDGEIVIRAWILTHPDGDHWGCLNAFANHYGSQVKLEYYVTQYHYNSYQSGKIASVVNKLDNSTKNFAGHQRIVPLAGQKMFFGELEVNFLSTPELPTVMKMDTNEQSLIMHMTFKDKTILMMGDAMGAAAADAGMYYDKACRADLFQAAHHALNPSPIDGRTEASAVIFCTHKTAAGQRKSSYEGLLNKGAAMIIADDNYKTIIN